MWCEVYILEVKQNTQEAEIWNYSFTAATLSHQANTDSSGRPGFLCLWQIIKGHNQKFIQTNLTEIKYKRLSGSNWLQKTDKQESGPKKIENCRIFWPDMLYFAVVFWRSQLKLFLCIWVQKTCHVNRGKHWTKHCRMFNQREKQTSWQENTTWRNNVNKETGQTENHIEMIYDQTLKISTSVNIIKERFVY